MSSTSKTTLINEDLLLEMECPVCTEYMHPPIKQCITGHSVCDRCFSKLKNCPTCRQPLLGTARNFTLELLHAKMPFPCKNRSIGCTKIEVGNKIVEHERSCKFSWNKCPLSVINDCSWSGEMKEIGAHCKEHHPNNIFFTSRQRLTCPNFLRNSITSTSYFFIIFNVYDEYFKCAWEVNFNTGYMRWCVFLMGNNKDSAKYEFEVEIVNQRDADKKIVLRSFCPPLGCEDSSLFNNSNFLLMHYDMVKNFCKTSDLVYCVSIYKNGGSTN